MEKALEITGTLVGLLYLWLEYRASIYLWLAGIVMPAVYIYVYYRAGLYADFGINVYYLLAALYGWAMWRRGHVRRELPISRMPRRRWLPAAGVLAATFGGIGWVLEAFTDSDVPWWDAFTTALSIVGMWMLARKYVEQWWAWFVVDVVCVGLYAYKGLGFTAVLYGVYAVAVIFGYLKWKRMMKEEETAQTIDTP